MSYITEISRSFRAMNTDVKGVICAADAYLAEATNALQEVERQFKEAEAVMSRFMPGSELSRLNESSGYPFEASPLLFNVVSAALQAAQATNGLFDPTILDSLIGAGYDRSFERLAVESKAVSATRASRRDWRDIRLNAESSLIYMPAGYGLDLGGIGKGWTVDRACDGLRRFPGFALDAGGDIVVGGPQASERPWTIGIANPFSEDMDLMELELTHGAICTSSTLRRRWHSNHGIRHHIIDPRTGEPARSGVIAATVTAQSAARAETIAKVAIILGKKDGMSFIDRQPGAEALLVLENGGVVCSTGFKEKLYVA